MDPRLQPLLQHLERHRGADAAEEQHRAEMLALLRRGGRPLDRDHWTPGHFTASAFVLSPDDRQLLLIFHGKLHRWLQPGGHIDAGDADALAAARRELREETGLVEPALVIDRPFDLDIHAIPARKGDPQHLHLDVRYLWRAPRWEICAGDDAQQARWVPLGEVAALESDASVLRAVAKLAGLLAELPGAGQISP